MRTATSSAHGNERDYEYALVLAKQCHKGENSTILGMNSSIHYFIIIHSIKARVLSHL